MAETEHVKVFKKGVTVWNRWRSQHRSVQPDLSHADLREASLRYANLNSANLTGANLEGANLGRAYLEAAELTGARPRAAHLFGADLGRATLRGADLGEAQLWNVRLEEADLREADLRDADLRDADLSSADLRDADLRGANLSGAFLNRCDLRRANLRGAVLDGAQLWGCRLAGASFRDAHMAFTALNNLNLSRARGLDTVVHEEPSSIGVDTLELTAAGLVCEADQREKIETFLRHAGVLESYLEVFRSLATDLEDYSSSFIRYSRADKAFAHKLYDELQERGVRCWLHEHPMLPGDDVHEDLDFGPLDRLLLCGSEASLTSWWIDHEIERAVAQEEELSRKQGEDVRLLIPIGLDGYVTSGRFKGAGEELLRARLAADFTGWDDDGSTFTDQVERLVKTLRT